MSFPIVSGPVVCALPKVNSCHRAYSAECFDHFRSVFRITILKKADKYWLSGLKALKATTIQECGRSSFFRPIRFCLRVSRFDSSNRWRRLKALRWIDVDYANWTTMTVQSPKTAHQGKASRVVPIFPELRPFLQAAWEEAPEGSEFVVGDIGGPMSICGPNCSGSLTGPG